MSSSSTPTINMSSSSTQSPISPYSSTVHELIVVINGGAIGLLQVTGQSLALTIAGDRQAIILSFCVFILSYAILRVSEVKLTRNQVPIHHFIGHISHLFGALAALMLISIVSPIFTLIVSPLWFVWFFVVMYVFLVDVICVEIMHQGDADPSDQISQHRSSGNEIKEEEEEDGAYSSTVHKLIILIDGGALGLLQVVTNQSSINQADRRATIFCFLVITLIYAILRVWEVKLRNKPSIGNFVGHVSHLFGALGALLLIFLISPTFTLIVVPLWLVWFFVVMYVSFSESVIPEDNAVDSPV